MKKSYYYILGLLILTPFLMGPICNGGGGGGGSTATRAAVNLSVKYPGISSTATECTSRLIWTFTPGTLTGSEGQSNLFTLDQSYSSSPDASHNCYFSELVGGLKAGTWTIQVTSGSWMASCVQTLQNGNNNVKFTFYRAGCTSGLSPYPGD